jgi:signal transduction histidine kinase
MPPEMRAKPVSSPQAGAPRSILRKGLILIATPLLFQAFVLAVLFWNEGASRDAERLALQTQQVIIRAESVMRWQFQDVSRMRGLILTQNPEFAVRTPRDVVAEVTEICRLVQDNPAQLRRAEALLADVRILEDRRVVLQDLVGAKNFAEATRLIRTLQGERRLRDTLRKLDDFLAGEERLHVERVKRLQQTRRLQQAMLLGALAAAVLITLLLARSFARGISSRLAAVTANARRIAMNLPLDPPLEGRDEIAELDRALQQTTRRLAAAALAERQHEAELEERAEELMLTNQDLEYKSREIETFVYSVSHDLRSPLVNLKGLCREIDLLCDDLWRTLNAVEMPAAARGELQAVEHHMRESVRFVLASVTSSGRLIDALLRLSRAGRMTYQWQNVDVTAVVRAVLDTLRMRLDEKGVQVTIGELPPARADLTAVEQIFANLLANAVNYLDPRRGGRIEIGAESGPPRSPITYWVRDNGLGIPKSFRDKLFVACQRFHANAAPGEGIGLSLVRRAVERHGGFVGVESEEGVGTTFLFTLPGCDPDDTSDADA